ncbi:MAG TPA: SulP family inorganic anion transporter [Nocardioides sp.]|uniref:SulP family inorganic anion transporter n=1 Tax=Nocardioides sp. TaxID=35761 RepID=UPI002B6135C4|nr:SulP family inorganic anion transporter [Nocardioides sp.]HTW14245.1 SulP family inorganic anion transporter [Nocardioides sp.]
MNDRRSTHASPTVATVLRSPRLLRTEVVAGLVVALAMIPEALSFSVLAGVDPRVGLFTSFTMAVSAAVLGGRPAMVSGAAGATALVIAPLVASHGMEYLVAAVLLAGLMQVALGLAGLGRLMRFIPRSVMVGFVNALCILIFAAQVPYLVGDGGTVYALAVLAILVLVLLPRFTRAVPAPLVAVVLLAVLVAAGSLDVPLLSGEGELPTSLPGLVWPDVPLTGETLGIIAPYALAMALVGLMESLMTAKLVDDLTDTRSSKTREALGQAGANLVTGFFGGMGGCAMIGQTMVNVKEAGARTRVSAFMTGVWLLILVVGLGETVGRIPMVALACVMVVVAVTTFDWHSVRPATLRRMPLSETAVMVVTVAVVVATENLAIGVIAGVLVATTLFARRVAHLAEVNRELSPDGRTATYHVTGELFFASSNDLYTQFAYAEDPPRVVIDLSDSHVWDASTVAALDAVETKYAARGTALEIVGLNAASAAMHERLSGKLG